MGKAEEWTRAFSPCQAPSVSRQDPISRGRRERPMWNLGKLEPVGRNHWIPCSESKLRNAPTEDDSSSPFQLTKRPWCCCRDSRPDLCGAHPDLRPTRGRQHDDSDRPTCKIPLVSEIIIGRDEIVKHARSAAASKLPFVSTLHPIWKAVTISRPGSNGRRGTGTP